MDAQEERKEEYSKGKEERARRRKRKSSLRTFNAPVHEECGSHRYRRPPPIVKPHLFSF
jgi:hypothetical protein